MAKSKSGMHFATVTGRADPSKEGQPKMSDFELFLPWACKELSIDADVIVTRANQEAYVAAVALAKKPSNKELSTLMFQTVDKLNSDDDLQNINEETVIELLSNPVRIKTLYDCNENLVKIQFLQNKEIPRKIMQVLGLTVSNHKLLTSITINSGLRTDTLYEMAKFLPDSNITEICLDKTILINANYHILLTTGKLKHLSLANCLINDDVVKTITDQLGPASPASRVLSALNLSSNRITDVGAMYITGMLRTNRQLCYLNLAGNMITDEGGMSILDTLKKFHLASQECLESRARYVAYLKKKNEFIDRVIKELKAAKGICIKKKKNKLESQSLQRIGWKSVLDPVAEARLIQERAEYLAETEIEPFNDPFSPDNTESHDGVVRCFGNNILCYLNLAHNNLTYISVKKLLEVLQMQRSLNRTPKGLIKVVIEGNLMPVTCKEYEEINRLFKHIVPVRRTTNGKTKCAKSIYRT